MSVTLTLSLSTVNQKRLENQFSALREHRNTRNVNENKNSATFCYKLIISNLRQTTTTTATKTATKQRCKEQNSARAMDVRGKSLYFRNRPLRNNNDVK